MSTSDAFLGALVADALAMPAHWYYDTVALRKDYGLVDHFMRPKNPHPDSILWRSEYIPINENGDILHDQAKYWGQRYVHYHQFLDAGENTINLKLAALLHRQLVESGEYNADKWLDSYIYAMLTPGWHNDTYLEEYHRAFFTRYAQGHPPKKCGIEDIHIGGLAHVPALYAALHDAKIDKLRSIVAQHVALTHRHSGVLDAADCFIRILDSVGNGENLQAVIEREGKDWFSTKKAEKATYHDDAQAIRKYYSPACYIDNAFPASLYLSWKYHDDFDLGIVANAMVGGDSCHRGVIVGALLGLANGVSEEWRQGLAYNNIDRSRAIASR